MRFLRFLEKITDILDKPFEWVVIIGFAVSTGLTFIEVIARYGFHASHEWASESVIYLTIYVVFIFGGVAFKRGAHIGMTFVTEKLPGRAKYIQEVGSNLLNFALCVFILWTSINFVKMTMSVGMLSQSGLIAIYIPLLSIPIGMSFFSLYAFEGLVRSVLKAFFKRAEVEKQK